MKLSQCLLLSLVLAGALSSEASGDDYHDCSVNLLFIRDALNEYQRIHKSLPERLSDLRGQYLRDKNRLFCPVAREAGGTSVELSTGFIQRDDSGTSYSYEFSLVPIPEMPRITMREWKLAQMAKMRETAGEKLVSSQIPIVRCEQHEGHGKGRYLNLPITGKLFGSHTYWEAHWGYESLDYGDLFAEGRTQDLKEASVSRNRKSLEIPPQRPELKGAPVIDLGNHYNGELVVSWDPEKEGNDLRELLAEDILVSSVDWDLRGVIQLDRRTPYQSKSISSAKGISVRSRCRKLLFLHGCSYGGDQFLEQKTKISSFLIRSGEEIVKEQEIRYGRHVMDWWHSPEHEKFEMDELTQIGWKGNNRASENPIYLYVTTVDLQTSIFVDSIDFVSSSKGPAPFLVGISFVE